MNTEYTKGGIKMNRELKGEIVKRYGSQFNFAHAIGWHEANVSRVIRGRVQIDDETKRKWAEILDVDMEKLFGKEVINGKV
jgi:plasmid maintenance system antidote protein VapI